MSCCFGRIGNQGLERGGQPVAGAAILDDVLDQELGQHLVGQAGLQLAGEIHAAARRCPTAAAADR